MRLLTLIYLLLGMFVTVNARADEAPYTESKPVVTIEASKPEFTIKLKSNPTTGFSWFLREYDQNLLEPIKHSYEAATDKKLMGATGFELWTFRGKPAAFVVPQQTMIRFTYSRPWETEDNNQVSFKVTSEAVTKDK